MLFIFFLSSTQEETKDEKNWTTSEGTEHVYSKVKIRILSLTDAAAKHWQVVKLFNLG